MKYVGIDLGTTNSAICSFDGEEVRLYKSPRQNDVTPSAIFIDKRGNKYVGEGAYDNAARNPDNAATGFKRFVGTSTPIELPAVNLTLTPVECSAEVLRVLFGYLPEEIRNSEDTGTVITVPAAFNQMQKDATLAAANSAGMGKVALMQEPVAAVMSVMRKRKIEGNFLVYDLGGGTLDIAIAASGLGRVNLLAHGGIAMCGGRDFDRILYHNIVKPWLQKTFKLPEDFATSPQFKKLQYMALWATEKAKIELSSREETAVVLPETELGVRDLEDEEIYLDIPFTRKQYDELIASMIEESVQCARDTLKKAHLTPGDIERVVFVGGPTNYGPLRDKVAFELGIAASTEVNPMTAVAEGAAIFAESIDWSTQTRARKNSRGSISAGGTLNLAFNYIARTPDAKAKVAAVASGEIAVGSEFQIDSLDTGWSSGRMSLKHGATTELPLSKPGENTFKVHVFDPSGGPLNLEQNKIVISRTAASIDAIPASHSISIAAKQKIGGQVVPVYLVREGDSLPKKGKVTFKTEESLRAGSDGSINFQIWEGEIEHPINDNRPVGSFKITGKDFDEGVIAAGADLICDYEFLDSGVLNMSVEVPSISGSFQPNHNFYCAQDSQIDFTKASLMVKDEASSALERIDEISTKVDDPRLNEAREKLEKAASISATSTDVEGTKHAMDSIQEVKRILDQTRKAHLKDIRQLELDKAVEFFQNSVREHARPSEVTNAENLIKTAQRNIESNSPDFESQVDELRGINYAILWRQDWFVIDTFKWLAANSYLFPDAQEHAGLVNVGAEALKANNMDKLRQVVAQLYVLRHGVGGSSDTLMTNIIAGV